MRALREVPRLYKQGYSIRQIMRKTGYKSTNSIQKILHKETRIIHGKICPFCGTYLRHP